MSTPVSNLPSASRAKQAEFYQALLEGLESKPIVSTAIAIAGLPEPVARFFYYEADFDKDCNQLNIEGFPPIELYEPHDAQAIAEQLDYFVAANRVALTLIIGPF